MLTTLTIHFGAMLASFIVLISITYILREQRPPATSLAWIIFIVLVPYVGIPLYLTFGARKVRSLIQSKHELFDASEQYNFPYPDIARMLANTGIPSPSYGNRIVWHKNGSDAYTALLSLIDGAKYEINIAIFILSADAHGEAVISHLTAQAARGIRVRLLLDGVGSFLLPKYKLQRLIKAGGEIAWFIPVIHRPFQGRTHLRNHRKYAIADALHVWTGGRNIASSYFLDDDTARGWVDLSYEIRGHAAEFYQHIFDADWAFATKKPFRQRPITKSGIISTPDPTSCIQVLPSGPDMRSDALRELLLTACYTAKVSIYAVTPYYIPDEGLQEAFCLAAKRGVEINLILPKRSNHKLADIARQRYLSQLHELGAKIWLLPDTMLHAKAILFDTKLAIAGSANLDTRSLLLNFEVVSVFYDKIDTDWLHTWLQNLCHRAEVFQPKSRNLFRESLEGVVLLFAYQL